MLSLLRFGALGHFLSDSSKKSDGAKSEDAVAVPKKYREPVAATKPLNVTLKRVDTKNYLLADLNDQGDLLYLTSPQNADYRQYLVVRKNKEEMLPREKNNIFYRLTDSGNVIRRPGAFRAGAIRQPRFFSTSITAYNEIKFFRTYQDDGSVIMVNYNRKNKETPLELQIAKSEQGNRTIYRCKYPISILEQGEDRSWWILETHGTKMVPSDVITHISGDKVDHLDLPERYRTVQRLVATKGMIAATFGSQQDKEPIRSFVREGSNWRELPIPEGYVYSFVQKVMFDGTIIGFVTDSEEYKFAQVVWKGGGVQKLDQLENWPKHGQITYITALTRRGDIFVRNVTDSATGGGDYYLLTIHASGG